VAYLGHLGENLVVALVVLVVAAQVKFESKILNQFLKRNVSSASFQAVLTWF
jgi:hypothetical protein